MKKILITLGVVVIAAIGWYLGSPLFIDKEVNEQAPVATNLEKQLTPDEQIQHQAMMEEVGDDVVMEESMEEMMLSDKATEPSPEENERAYPLTVSDGIFAAVGHEGTGTALLVQTGPSSYVLRFEDLDVLNGPDLRVLLSPNTNIEGSGDLGEYIELGKLKGNKGDQNYIIPSDVDVSEYKSVVIYCKPFHVVFNTAELNKTAYPL